MCGHIKSKFKVQDEGHQLLSKKKKKFCQYVYFNGRHGAPLFSCAKPIGHKQAEILCFKEKSILYDVQNLFKIR